MTQDLDEDGTGPNDLIDGSMSMPMVDIPGVMDVRQHDTTYLNILLYGPPKSGKTAGALSIPGNILYLNADTSNALKWGRRARKKAKLPGEIREVRLRTYEALTNLALILEKGDSGYQTLVLDPLGDVYRMLLEDASNSAVRPRLDTYGDTGTYLERFCRRVTEAPINVVFIAHDIPVKDETTGAVEYLPATGTSNPALGRKVMGMVDILGYTGVLKAQGVAPRYVAQLLDAGGRHGGDRFGTLADAEGVADLNLGYWIQMITGQVPVATDSQEETLT